MNQYYSLEQNEISDWSDYIFIMPAISIGNVGQLAVDLLLATLEVDLVGHIHCNAVLPFVGLDPFRKTTTNLVTSCQVYENKKLKMVIMQQRSPIAKDKRTDYVNFMTNWIKEKSFKKVVMLSSSLSQFQMPDSRTDDAHGYDPMFGLSGAKRLREELKCTEDCGKLKEEFWIATKNILSALATKHKDHKAYCFQSLEPFSLKPRQQNAFCTRLSLIGLPMHFLCTPNQDDTKENFQNMLKWRLIVQRDHFNREIPSEDIHLLPGAGLTVLFYKTCIRKMIPLVVLVHYCSEGDNIPDAVTVANNLNRWLDFIQPEWKKPVSWNLLFGNTLPRGIC